MDYNLSKLGSEFVSILKKARGGGELTVEDGVRLLEAKDQELDGLLKVADEVRKDKVGNVVTFVINRNINFTNICKNSCKFCAFSRPSNSRDAYVLTEKEVSKRTREALEKGATEICFQGGINPSLTFQDYLDYLQAIRRVSKDIHIHAYSPAEIDYMCSNNSLNLEETINELREYGLDSVPGTAAEILIKRVRKIICPNKISVDRWEEIIRTCHNSGIPSTATIMYGHVETPEEIASHLVKLREIQKETGGFTELVPLGFAKENTELKKQNLFKHLSDRDHLKMHAVARLMLVGHIDNIQTSWVKLGPKLAQRSLDAGANDFSGTLMEENITRAAGGEFQKLEVGEIRSLVREAGKVPRERTTTYEMVAEG